MLVICSQAFEIYVFLESRPFSFGSALFLLILRLNEPITVL